MLGHASAAITLDVYAGLFADDLDSVADRLDSLVPQMRHKGTDNVIDLPDARVGKLHLTRQNTSVGPVGLEPTTYGEMGVHRSPQVPPVAKRALPGSERATCSQLGRLRDSIVAARATHYELQAPRPWTHGPAHDQSTDVCIFQWLSRPTFKRGETVRGFFTQRLNLS
jgi:hypothetical protein